jgi:ABC-type branched-subunit amino acid transport system permease subunit
VVALALVLGILVQRYLNSVSGQALAAIKTNETRLEFVGISAYRVLLTGYVLSAALCGLSGAIFAITQGLVTPEMGYWVRSGEIVFIAILGGIGHPVGAFLGAGIFEFVKVFAAAYMTSASNLVLGVVLIAMVFFAPRGISGLLAPRAGRKQGDQP